ncbi:JmjC domain-containing protein [Artemisia annua]|uniref:JmjC domain-containing protein n=1 Tax=Artemisia annua TaxID=35608 RepID=A0A2U1QEP7_ARTAN|nr:JmjC domain-containing protein [Artemisia annua]
MRDVSIPDWLKELPLAPVFYPTDTEFADPIAYISKIEKQASAFGICKVIPPLPKPSKKYVVNNLNKSLLKSPELGRNVNVGKDDRAVFTTRHQELGRDNGKGGKEVNKQVWQSGEIYTLEQFELKSKVFAKSQLGVVKDVTPLDVESRFWKAASEKPIYIEYANDVPGSGFGEPVCASRFMRKRRRRRRNFKRYGNDGDERRGERESVKCSGSSEVDVLKKDTSLVDDGREVEGTAGWKLSNCPWNLQVIARSPGSLTRFMPDDIPGVTSPMVYLGMLFSWFAWHVEDHELHSLNFLHIGAPKTWYSVPGDYAFTFEEVIRSKAYGGIDRLAALTLLGEKTTLLSPETVVASGIPCCRLVQYPGEFVVTFPRAYHIGFSHGFNCGEAANFGTPKWLSVAKEAAVRRAAMNFLPMLSHQQLLYLLTMSFIPRVPKSLLPGIRSSRSKDRQKEERELLVKKEFIEDILKENKLINHILQRNSAYHAVLWDLESLSPSVITESDLKNIDDIHVKNDNNLDSETVVNIEDEDMSSDFQIDSGSLPCVACGVLGYPFMSVIQPTTKMLIDEMPVTGHGVESVNAKDRSLEASTNSCEMNVEKGWNISNGFLRPQIFCLKHASKVMELLDSMGGAKLLIICHSDFLKIKIQVSAIAEQIGSTFRYNEVRLDEATQDDLDLINLAIDNEQDDESVEDWTLKLNVNLRQSVKLRPKSSPDKIHNALIMDALFADAPTSSVDSRTMIFQWQATKSRSNRKLNSSIKKFSKTVDVEVIDNISEAQIPKKGGSLIQYSRRKFKSKRQDTVANLSKDRNEDDLLVSGDLSTPGNPVTQQEKEDSVLSQVGVDVIAPLVAEDAEAHTSMEMEGGSESCATTLEKSGTEKGEESDLQNEISFVATDNGSLEQGSEDGLMQEDTELTKDGGSSADEPVIDSNDNVKEDHVTDNDENNNVSNSKSGGKRKREVELLQREEKSDFDGFVKSPCEGLRPRGGKDSLKGGINISTKTIPEKPTKKSKPSNVTEKHAKKPKASNVKTSEKTEHKSHKCDIEGCKLSFKTKTELRLHRKNRCPHVGCGKKFKSHRYAVIHVRVHEDHRPLKCTWKGCKMTFKWAWARTEHIRVHTGERPYKCSVEGCGLNFRFVSDFSRHRRKTGHNVHVKS